jgi:hypothetical protein
MKILIVVCLVSVALMAVLIAFGQSDRDYLVIRAKVVKIQETDIEEGASDNFHIVDYEVMKVCKGKYADHEIKVAHIIGTAKQLKVGDVICRRLKATNRFKEMAQIALKEFGRSTPEEFLADYVFAGVNRPCSCDK